MNAVLRLHVRVGSTSVSICEEPKEETSSGGEQSAPEPEEEPRIPCKTDAECDALQSGLICAQFQGQRDCTIPCSQESDRDTPAVGGMSIDFMTCIADEGDSSRNACLPDVACFNNPMDCVTMPGMDDMGGMDDMDDMDDFDDFDDDFWRVCRYPKDNDENARCLLGIRRFFLGSPRLNRASWASTVMKSIRNKSRHKRFPTDRISGNGVTHIEWKADEPGLNQESIKPRMFLLNTLSQFNLNIQRFVFP